MSHEVITNLEEISTQEKYLLDAVTTIPAQKIPFPLDTTSGNRSQLRIGDIIFAEETTTGTHMGLLVFQRSGWDALSTPLFYLKNGLPVTVDEIDFHRRTTVLKPRVDEVNRALKPMDERGHQHTFVPTRAEIIRPISSHIQETVVKYTENFTKANYCTHLAFLCLVVGAGVGAFFTWENYRSGIGVPQSGLIFDTALIGLGGIAFAASRHYESKANLAYNDFQIKYPGLYPLNIQTSLQQALNTGDNTK